MPALSNLVVRARRSLKSLNVWLLPRLIQQAIKHPAYVKRYYARLSNDQVKQLAALAEQYGRYELALALVQAKLVHKPTSFRMKVEEVRYLIRLGATEELKVWFQQNRSILKDTFVKLPRPQLVIAALRAGEALGDASIRPALLSDARDASRDLLTKVAKPAIGLLHQNRLYREMYDSILAKGRVLPWKTVKRYAVVPTSQLFPENIEHWAEQAQVNEITLPGERSNTLTSGKPTRFKDDRVEIFIPSHFYADWDQARGAKRQQNWSEIRRLFGKFVAHADQTGLNILPRHQYFLNLAASTPKTPSISYFTKGGDRYHWHMRDLGLGENVAIDPDGYFGHSSLSLLDSRPWLDKAEFSAEQIDESVSALCAMYSAAGGDKYNPATAPPTDSHKDIDGIFCPLQSPAGLEASDVSVEDIIRLLTQFSRETGVRIHFRRHPLCNSPFVTQLLEQAIKEANCVLSDVSPWILAKHTGATVTINSATLIQPLAAGRPVYTWGRSDFHTATTDVGDYGAFKENMIRTLAGENPLLEKQRAFLHFYMTRYLVDFGSRDAVERRLRLIKRLSGGKYTEDSLREAFLDDLLINA